MEAEKSCKESAPFYHTAAWKRARQAALLRDRGMCCECMDRIRSGIGVKPNRATMVHHVIPITERPDLALDLNNLRSLCWECHNREHPEKGGSPWKAREEPKHRMAVVKV